MAQIKITGDVSGLKKSILEVQKLTQDLSKQKVSLLSPETSKLFNGMATDHMERLKQKTAQAERIAVKYAQRMRESAKGSAEELKYQTKILDVLKRRGELQRQMLQLQRTQRPGFLSGLGHNVERIPGVGTITGAFEGMGLMGGLGLLGGAAAIGAGFYGYHRMGVGYARYSAGLNSRIALMGRGAYDTQMAPGLQGSFAQMGMNEEAVRQARLQAMDIFGSRGASQRSVLARAQFATNYGVSLQTLQGYGTQMQAQVGTAGANRDIIKLQASLQASAIKDAIGPYLASAASLLADIRNNDYVNSEEVLGLMASLSKLGASPQRAAQLISGFQSAVRGSSGENNAILQMAFSKAGVGSRDVGAIQAEIQAGGIFGINFKDYAGLSGSDVSRFRKMGIGTTTSRKKISSLFNMVDKLYGGRHQSGDAMLAEGRMLMGLTGTKSPVEAIALRDLFRKGLNNPAAMKQFEGRLKNDHLSPQQKMLTNLQHINSSQAGSLRALQTIRNIQEEALGKEVAPAVMKIQNLLFHIDKIIGSVYNGIASFIPGMQTDQGKLNNVLGGNGVLSGYQIQNLRAGGKSSVINFGAKLALEANTLRNEISRESRYGDAAQMKPHIDVLKKELANVNESMNKLYAVHKEHLEIAKQQAQHTKKASQALSKPHATIPSRVTQ